MAAGDDRRAYRNVSGSVADRASGIPVDFPADDRGGTRTLVPAGGGMDVRLIEGLEGVLHSNTAVGQQLGDLASELKVLNDRQRTMYGQQASSTGSTVPADQSALVDAIKQGVQQGVETLRATLPTGSAPAPAPASPAASPARRGTALTGDWLPGAVDPATNIPLRQKSPVSSAEQDDTRTEIAEAAGVPGEPTIAQRQQAAPYDTFQHTRDYFGGRGKFTVANLRQDLGSSAAKHLENFSYGEQLVEDPHGALHHPSDVEGEFGDYADEASIAAFMRRQKIAGAAKGAAQALSQGSTMSEAGLGALGAGAARVAGVAGAVVYAGDKLGDFAEGQRAANNQWVAMNGGDQSEAFGERLRGRLFRYSQFGVLGDQDADLLYRGTAATGMDRDQRNNAQDFAVQNYKDLGMGIAESLEIIQYAAEHNQESLSGLADALRDVTDAANEAGVNTETARKSFVENWKTFSTVFEGPAATTLAAGYSSAQADMGREFQNLDFSGVASADQIRMLAASQGMTTNQILAQSMERGGEIDLTRQMSDRSNEIISGQLGPRAMQAIKDAWDNRNDPTQSTLSDVEVDQLQEKLLSDPSYGVPDLTVLPQILSQMTGVNGLEPANVLKYAINSVAGGFDPTGRVSDQVVTGQTKTLEGFDDWKNGGVPGQTAAGYPMAGNERLGAYAALSRLNGPNTDQWRELKSDLQGDVGSAFEQDALKTGRIGGISQILATEDSGIDKVEVETEDGARVVSLEDAMRYFRDQVDRGDITVAEGENKGATLAEVAKTEGDESIDAASAKNEDFNDIGQSKADFDKEQAASGGGKVTISPSPYLLRYFQFSGTGVNIDPEASLSPPPSDVTADGRPTGQTGW